jgi:hypothetical protein
MGIAPLGDKVMTLAPFAVMVAGYSKGGRLLFKRTDPVVVIKTCAPLVLAAVLIASITPRIEVELGGVVSVKSLIV